MRITKIEEEANGLLVLVGEDYDYFIPKTAYELVIKGNISSWIEQIMWKNWADIHSLYRIGAILSKHCPAGIIDWVETFESAELMHGTTADADPLRIKEKMVKYGFRL
jgi:hypothetical protein